jgi:hypothetical protein
VFPAVVVDFSVEAPVNAVEWVLDACNAAISAGACVSERDAAQPAPRAVAIVRALKGGSMSVRIEVGLDGDEQASWLVRVLEFSRQDPVDERWRSVGLAVATLVGEVEATEKATPDRPPQTGLPPTESQPELAASAPLPEPPAQAEPERPKDVVTPDVPPAVAEPDEPLADVAELPAEPLVRPVVFAGIGALAAQGSVTEPLRWGGGGRGGWLFGDGWELSIAGDYSQLSLLTGGADVSWVRTSAGLGYRMWFARRWSASFSAHLGVRMLRIDARGRQAAQRISSTFSPLARGSVDVWWQLAHFGGLWASIDVASIGRRTRLIGADGEPVASLPLGDASGVLGLWWNIQ